MQETDTGRNNPTALALDGSYERGTIIMKIGILGSGAGGQTLAFDASQKGFDVILSDHPSFMENLRPIKKNQGIYSIDGDSRIHADVTVADSVADVLETDIVFVVTPAYGTKPMAETCRPYLKKGQHYVICPGSGGGALEFKKNLGIDLLDPDVIVGETHTLPYATRMQEPGFISIFHYVNTLILTALPSVKAERLSEVPKGIWGEKIKIGKNVLETALIDGNPVIHPVVTLLNVALIERTKGNFQFYAEGITNGVADLMQAVDEERLAIAKALGLDIATEPQMSYCEGYMEQDKVNYREGYKSSSGFKGIMAQDKLEHRFFTEDVGYVMVFWSSLAKLIGVKVPTIEAIITLTSKILGRDLMEIGARTVSGLGLTKKVIAKI